MDRWMDGQMGGGWEDGWAGRCDKSHLRGLGGLVPGRVHRALGSSRDDWGGEVEGKMCRGPGLVQLPGTCTPFSFLQECCHLAVFRGVIYSGCRLTLDQAPVSGIWLPDVS